MWPRKREKETDSRKALEQAKQNLTEAQEKAPKIAELSSASKKLRERNHFAEQLASIMGGLQ